MIRAAQVAKHIGITSQELRKMLSEVNFGVRPTDREFPETLTSGIIRFAARKLNRDIQPLIQTEDEGEEEQEEENLKIPKNEEDIDNEKEDSTKPKR